MIDCGRRFLDGESEINELHLHAEQLKQVSKQFNASIHIQELASEWSAMSGRLWNEWGLVKNPVSESDFREWLSNQLDTI